MTVTTATPPRAHTLEKTVGGRKVTLTPEQADAFGRELDALKDNIIADLGERDATYIRRMIKAQRALEVGGRALLYGSIFPPFSLAGTAMLTLAALPSVTRARSTSLFFTYRILWYTLKNCRISATASSTLSVNL